MNFNNTNQLQTATKSTKQSSTAKRQVFWVQISPVRSPLRSIFKSAFKQKVSPIWEIAGTICIAI
jgi:hypothetical protein